MIFSDLTSNNAEVTMGAEELRRYLVRFKHQSRDARVVYCHSVVPALGFIGFRTRGRTFWIVPADSVEEVFLLDDLYDCETYAVGFAQCHVIQSKTTF